MQQSKIYALVYCKSEYNAIDFIEHILKNVVE